MPKFMMLVKASADTEAGVLPTTEQFAEMGRYNEELVKAGVLLAGDGLHPSRRGARIEFRGNTKTVVDGPFAETKELIAGFWIIQAKSLDEAVEWARRAPNPHFGGDTNIGDPTAHKTFQDPFVFLLHANVDRLFAMWQCQPGQEWRRDPQLVYGNESNDVALTETLAPWDGTRRVHPWTAEGGQIDARNSRHPLIVSPPRYDSIPE